VTTSLTFLEAAVRSPAPKHLLDLGDHRILVDCGLFQGLKELRHRNSAALPIPATRIVIASSGMATGGRVLHHLAAALPSGALCAHRLRASMAGAHCQVHGTRRVESELT
jgi:Cft2 family RNA processing exonuclease